MTNSIRRLAGIVAILIVAIFISSCAESQRPNPTGKGSIRSIGAIVDAPEILFRIEERVLGQLTYKGVLGFREYDDFLYNFNFDLSFPGELETTRMLTHTLKVNADMEHTLIVTGSVDNPVVVEWEDSKREWADTETVVEPIFANFSPAVGNVDVYFAAPGTVPLLGNEIGTLSNGERLPPIDFEGGIYELILTPIGEPSNILYMSEIFDTGARNRPIFAIFDADPTIPGPVAVSLITAQEFATPIPDPRYPSQIRLYHGGLGTENVDVYFDDDFTNRIFSDIGFKELSPYADIANGVIDVTLTAVNNPGAIILEREVIATAGTLRTISLAGAPGNLLMTVLLDLARPLSTYPVMRIANWAINKARISIYLLEPGTEITDMTLVRFSNVPSLIDTGFVGIEAGMHEMTVTEFLSIVPIAPSVILDLDAFNIVDVAILDTVDPDVLEIEVFDFQ